MSTMKPIKSIRVSLFLTTTFVICVLTASVNAQTDVAQSQSQQGTAEINAPERANFQGDSVSVETDFLGDERRTSVNDSDRQSAGANPFGGGGFQSFFQNAVASGFGQNFGTQQPSKSRVVRAPLRIGFEVAATSRVSTPTIAQQVSFRFMRLPRFRDMSIQAFAKEDGTVALSGFVDNEESKQLAERQLRLEPGVKKIDNQLIVTQTDVSEQ